MKVYAIEGIHLRRMIYLRLSNTTEMVRQINVCAIHAIQFALMNYLLLGNTKETVS